MCRASTPKPPPVLPEAPVAPNVTGSQSSADVSRRRRTGAMGTLLTGPMGTTNATTGGLTLLGRAAGGGV